MGSLPMTNTMKVIKTTLRYDFIYRTPEMDEDREDVIYEVRDKKARPFSTDDYKDEIKKYSDPTNRDRLTAFTRRKDLFED
jgi:hypothetical protein